MAALPQKTQNIDKYIKINHYLHVNIYSQNKKIFLKKSVLTIYHI